MGLLSLLLKGDMNSTPSRCGDGAKEKSLAGDEVCGFSQVKDGQDRKPGEFDCYRGRNEKPRQIC